MSDTVSAPLVDAGVSTRGISLVLGSGGARGYAHIGVIEELLAHGFNIESIAGSSMGALIGGVYAAGKLDAYRNWVGSMQRYDVWRMLDWTMTGGGFIKGDRIIGAMRDLVGETNIEDLSIPYTAVAVDMDAQREVWLSRGSLFDAIRASIATPAIFRPHRYQGRTLVDGGLLNPVPVSATLRDLTDCTIAVDVNGLAEPLGSDAIAAGSVSAAVLEPGLVELFVRSLDTVQATITRFKLAAQPPDLLITIPRNACAFYEFHRAEELIDIGRRRAREALQRWHRPPPRRAT